MRVRERDRGREIGGAQLLTFHDGRRTSGKQRHGEEQRRHRRHLLLLLATFTKHLGAPFSGLVNRLQVPQARAAL